MDGLPLAQVPQRRLTHRLQCAELPEPDAAAEPMMEIHAAALSDPCHVRELTLVAREGSHLAQPSPAEQEEPARTLSPGAVVGTLTLGFDGEEGERLHCEALFPNEVRLLRTQGHRLCEFNRLALEQVREAKPVLAALFHVAYLVAFRAFGCDQLLIEVNPRHVRWYVRMLGFRALGPEGLPPPLNPALQGPAVLLALDLQHSQQHIARWAGQPEQGPLARSLYPYFFSSQEATHILDRLRHRLPAAPFPDPPPARDLA